MSASPQPLVAASAKNDRSFGTLARDVLSLTKPRLSGLVLFTTAGGMWLSKAPLSWWQWLVAMLGTAGTVASANAFNCYLERESDRYMARTAVRPLPQQRLEPTVALVFAGGLALISLPVLFIFVNPLTGLLGLLALASYVLVYTPMKKRTRWAMVVGAIPGALPPLMGWTAASGRVETPGLVLFGILFLWQLPHFLAIALFRKAEYRAAGLTSVPLEKGDAAARLQAVLYLAALVPVSLLPVAVGVAGPLYFAVALVLGLGFSWVAVEGWRKELGDAWARKLFGASLLYLTGLFAALAIG
jgi:protoheme IX farnesyltransferase